MIEFIARISRRLPGFRGKYRLLRAAFSRAINKEKDISITGRNNISYLLPNINEVIGFSLYINGVYEPEFIEFIIKRVPRNGVFIDAGANIGSICIPVAKRRPDITIVAVEASPKVFRYLAHNVQVNHCHNIRPVNKALSDTDGLSIQFYSPEGLFGKGSMSPVFTKEGESVSTVTIDSLAAELNIDRIDFMKIDVEGHEKKVFQGMNRFFRERKIGNILFEFVDWAEEMAEGCKPGDAQQLLLEKGFGLSLCTGNSLAALPGVLKKGSAMLYAKQ